MEQVIEAYLLGEAATPREREAVRSILASHPELREAFTVWREAREHIRAGMHRAVPDRSLLACYALEAAGMADALSDAERAELHTARPMLERAIESNPGLGDIVRRIQADADVFESTWREHVVDETLPEPRRDRMPVSGAVRSFSRRRRWAWRAASVVAVVAFALMASLIVSRNRGKVTVTADSGGFERIELADGSVVRLASGSTLSYHRTDEGASFRRQVRLLGRAFFEVQPGEQVFAVHTPAAIATVLGTSFTVDAGDESSEIVLASGRVAVAPTAAPDHMVVLNEGEMSRVSLGALPSTPVPVDVSKHLEWTGLFIFRGHTVAEIAGQLERHYQIDIAVDPSLDQEPVSGTFEHSQSAAEILDAIAAALGAELQSRGDGRYVLRGGAGD